MAPTWYLQRVGERLVNRDEDLLTTASALAPQDPTVSSASAYESSIMTVPKWLAGAIAASSWSGERTTDRPTVDPLARSVSSDDRSRARVHLICR
jgi:hypothetical protein